MIPIAISQRVTILSDRKERRDAIDQKWFEFFHHCDLLPVLIPNHQPLAEKILDQTPVEGVLLTGGNDLTSYGGDAPERDATELFLLQYCLDYNLPLLGVCRGMQLIQDHFGVKLKKVLNHVATTHTIEIDDKKTVVNSFHNYAAIDSTDDLEILGRSDDDVVEAIQHKHFPIRGIMWHPERNYPFEEFDVNLVKSFFTKKEKS
jgi:gamma-glutamyl-gamma-aminobutyrate hydrolase PuuD